MLNFHILAIDRVYHSIFTRPSSKFWHVDRVSPYSKKSKDQLRIILFSLVFPISPARVCQWSRVPRFFSWKRLVILIYERANCSRPTSTSIHTRTHTLLRVVVPTVLRVLRRSSGPTPWTIMIYLLHRVLSSPCSIAKESLLGWVSVQDEQLVAIVLRMVCNTWQDDITQPRDLSCAFGCLQTGNL